ncbi:mas [Symbiodinium sp. CCMP2592]|nr:mas [Symbiodinium sp. CCMP2592]
MRSNNKDRPPTKQTECLVKDLLPTWFVIEFGSLRPRGYNKAFYSWNDGVRANLQKAKLLDSPACHFHSGYATDLLLAPRPLIKKTPKIANEMIGAGWLPIEMKAATLFMNDDNLQHSYGVHLGGGGYMSIVSASKWMLVSFYMESRGWVKHVTTPTMHLKAFFIKFSPAVRIASEFAHKYHGICLDTWAETRMTIKNFFSSINLWSINRMAEKSELEKKVKQTSDNDPIEDFDDAKIQHLEPELSMAASVIEVLSAKNEKLREHVKNVAGIRCENCNEKIPIVLAMTS